ncbi:MAG: glycosyltransferase [bacterium]
MLELIDGGFIGGGQTHILSLAQCIDIEHFNVVIAASAKGKFKEEVLKSNLKFNEIELPKFYMSRYLKDLNEIIVKNSIDIIHSHGGVAGMYSRFYAKKYNKAKVIHTIHGIHYINSGSSIRKIVSQSIESYLKPFTDRFICVSEHDLITAQKMQIIVREKTSVIKNGVDLNRFKKKNRAELLQEDFISKLNLNQEDFIIGNISRFDYQKNQKFIISNSEYFLNTFPGSKILLCGDGKYLNECKQMADSSRFSHRIIFTGEITNPEKYYSLFDVFIFPSMWEGLSITLIEAMASSCCILASDIPSNKELIEDNSTGVFFKLGDQADFRYKLLLMMEDNVLRNELSLNAESESKKYSREKITKKIETEYHNLLTNKL